MNSLAKVYEVQDRIGQAPAVEMPVRHHFAPGLYLREIFMPAGTLVVGKMHRTCHYNIITQGVVKLLSNDGTITEHRAGDVFLSNPGVKKVLYIVEDTRWLTPHPTNKTDMIDLEAELIVPEDQIRDAAGNLIVSEADMQKLLGVVK